MSGNVPVRLTGRRGQAVAVLTLFGDVVAVWLLARFCRWVWSRGPR